MKPTVISRRSGGRSARAVGMAAVLLAGLALAGCGLGPGEDTGDAGLLVTRDYGTEALVDEPEMTVNESSTAMRLLDEKTDLETTYGGEYVQAVDGLAGGTEGGRRFDWFFAVNGIVAERGSAQFPLTGGDLVWWDYRDWTDAMEVGAVVGSYPAPFSTGYDNRDWGVQVDCQGDETACGMVTKQLEGDGVELNDRDDDMILRVGTFDDLSGTDEGKRLQRGPSSSGVFARFESEPAAGDAAWHLVGLKVDGDVGQDFDPDTGLIAAMRRADDPPVWLVTGGTDEAVQAAAAALTPDDLERRYAAFVTGGQIGSLPLP
ncbi:MAG: DUF4430 domain-containing protein [Solirubrobacterales bacterium]|nr:DUF4430 domain-containing protein [Solirubrobacterales bacterium]